MEIHNNNSRFKKALPLKLLSGRGLLRLSALFVMGTFLLLNFQPVLASTQDDANAIQGDYTFYDPNAANPSACSSNNASGGTPGNVYFVGDSIGTQVQTSLPGPLTDQQFKANALSGRNLSVEPPSPSGLGALDQDQDYIKTASVVVVELGTNSGGFTAENVGQMVSKIKELSPNAAIYWVDTAVVQRQDYAKTLDAVNGVIYGQATSQNFKVISWNKKVFGSSADPTNINPDAPDNGYIRRSDQYVHLTDAGVSAMTDLIASTIKGAASGSNCACTLLAGNNNEEKVWNYFITKGLSPIQVAGLMGNIQSESAGTWDPTITEGGGHSDTPKNGQGFGLIQWTFTSRQQPLVDRATAANKKPSDLGVQLDYIWFELTTKYKSVGEGLKQAQNLEDATYLVLIKYETPADIPGNKPVRLGHAQEILSKFGSGTSGGDAAGSTGC